METGSQAVIGERAFQAEGIAEAIKQEHAYQVGTARRTVELEEGREGGQRCDAERALVEH